jgi:arsenate reductase (thioredoxin)
MVSDGSGGGSIGGSSGKTGGVRGNRHRLLGPRSSAPAGTSPDPGSTGNASSEKRPTRTSPKQRVLFVCIGNSCRSQMAEAFARAYGADVMEVQSAGVNPAVSIAPLTRQTLAEHNLSIEDHFPKGLDTVSRTAWDVLVNMSGRPVSLPGARTISWQVRDPIGQSEQIYRDVAGQLERLVMRLILELRGGD